MSTQLPHQGLGDAEVAERIAAGQANVSHERTSRSLSDILRANLFTPFNGLIGVLFAVMLLVGSPVDALFGIVIVINSAIGISQELRAKRTLDRLAIVHTPRTRAIRDGRVIEIPIEAVVLGDVLKLERGDQVPADGQVLSSEGLEIDESLLTGESDALTKQPNDSVLSSSLVVAGSGFIRTTAVGVDSYAHNIAVQVKRFSRTRSELVDGTNRLLGYISWTLAIVAPLLIWGQIAHSGNTWQEALVRSTAAIVGMIPEGLVLLTSFAFMLATLTLARRNVLVQQLPAVEGLARVDVICLDKTGTLTDGTIAFEELRILDNSPRDAIAAALATLAAKPDSPTLHALHKAFTAEPFKTIGAVPFSSARKWSAVTLSNSESWIMGAPEMVLPEDASQARWQTDTIARSGKRILVLLRSSEAPTTAGLPSSVQPAALVVFQEKIRADATETLRFFAQQGIHLKVISGDNPHTVGAVARAVGLPADEPIDARTLPSDLGELAEILEKHSIFGRVLPQQKRAIVKALQFKKHVVAMTGDGVNDALALKDADIGIAMGNGAQATKAIADLVLLDNRFARMPNVLSEGRRVIANIERVANLFLIKNVYALCLSLAVTVAAMPYPFLPRHMSVISALTIGIPAFFLALAPNNRRYIPGFLPRVLKFAVPTGIVITALIVTGYLVADGQGGSPTASSTVVTTIVVTVGMWVLLCLARPLKPWKTGLVALMALIFVGLMAAEPARMFLGFSTDTPHLGLSLGLGLTGAAFIEALWRFDQRVSPRQ